MYAALSLLAASASDSNVQFGRAVNVNQPLESDQYIAGGTVNINAPVHGELVVAGGKVFINDTITGNITVLAGEIWLARYAGANIRCAAGSLHVKGNVAGNIAVTGGNIQIYPGANIGGLIGAGGSAIIKGTVHGNIQGSFGELVVTGPVSGAMDCRGARIMIDAPVAGDASLAAAVIETGNRCFFARNLRYWNRQEKLQIDRSRIEGNMYLDYGLEIQQPRWYYLGAATLLGLCWYLGMILSCLLFLQWALGKIISPEAMKASTQPFTSMGYGFLFVIGTPVIAALLICTLIGIPLGILLLGAYVVVLLSATLIASVLLANLYAVRNQKKRGYWRTCFTAFGIFIICRLVMAVPFLGWIAILLLTLWALGVIIIALKNRYKKIA